MPTLGQDDINHQNKTALFDVIAEVAGALSAGRRMEIIDILAQGERSVEEIALEVQQSIANTSHHLRTLARSGLISSRRDGKHIFYRLANDQVEEVWIALKRAAESVRPDLEHLADAYLGDLTEVHTVDRDKLLEQMAQGSVTVVDVRPLPEYRAGHIPGARSIPFSELACRIAELPRDIPVVAYCRGPYCVFAPAAVRTLRTSGLTAFRLVDGFPEWRRDGLPTEVG